MTETAKKRLSPGDVVKFRPGCVKSNRIPSKEARKSHVVIEVYPDEEDSTVALDNGRKAKESGLRLVRVTGVEELQQLVGAKGILTPERAQALKPGAVVRFTDCARDLFGGSDAASGDASDWALKFWLVHRVAAVTALRDGQAGDRCQLELEGMGSFGYSLLRLVTTPEVGDVVVLLPGIREECKMVGEAEGAEYVVIEENVVMVGNESRHAIAVAGGMNLLSEGVRIVRAMTPGELEAYVEAEGVIMPVPFGLLDDTGELRLPLKPGDLVEPTDRALRALPVFKGKRRTYTVSSVEPITVQVPGETWVVQVEGVRGHLGYMWLRRHRSGAVGAEAKAS